MERHRGNIPVGLANSTNLNAISSAESSRNPVFRIPVLRNTLIFFGQSVLMLPTTGFRPRDISAALAEKSPSDFRFSHKVTDTITIKNFPSHKRHGDFSGQPNPCYLNADIFLQSFLSPLVPFRERTGLIIFEFSVLPERLSSWEEFVSDLDSFLSKLPTSEWDFGVEIRNPSFCRSPTSTPSTRHSVESCLQSMAAHA